MINLYNKCCKKRKKSLWWCLSHPGLVLYVWVTSDFNLLRFKKTVWSFLSEAFPQSFITLGGPPLACGRSTLLSIVAHARACTFSGYPRQEGACRHASLCGRALDPRLPPPLWPRRYRNSEQISYPEGVSGNHRWNQQKYSSFYRGWNSQKWKPDVSTE